MQAALAVSRTFSYAYRSGMPGVTAESSSSAPYGHVGMELIALGSEWALSSHTGGASAGGHGAGKVLSSDQAKQPSPSQPGGPAHQQQQLQPASVFAAFPRQSGTAEKQHLNTFPLFVAHPTVSLAFPFHLLLN